MCFAGQLKIPAKLAKTTNSRNYSLSSGPVALLDFDKQSEWGVIEWRIYALYLQGSEESLQKELSKTKLELNAVYKKLSRRKKPIKPSKQFVVAPGRTLLTGELIYLHPNAKRGRKPNSKCRELAKATIEKRAEMESQGKHVTDQEALQEIYADKGLGRWRVNGNRSILNEISKIRKETNTLKRNHNN